MVSLEHLESSNHLMEYRGKDHLSRLIVLGSPLKLPMLSNLIQSERSSLDLF